MTSRLTLISITYKGKVYSKFVLVNYNNKGKALFDYDTFASEIGIHKGETYIPA